MDAASNRAAILARIGGDFSSVQREYAPQLTTAAITLCPPACRVRAPPAACGRGAGDRAGPAGGVDLNGGPIAIGSMAAENFLMESAEGMPADQVAWGRLSASGSAMCSRSTASIST